MSAIRRFGGMGFSLGVWAVVGIHDPIVPRLTLFGEPI